MRVGTLIKRARLENGLSQNKAAKYLKFSEQFLGRIESGAVSLPITRVKRAQKIFKLSRTRLRNAFIEDFKTEIKTVLPVKTTKRR